MDAPSKTIYLDFTKLEFHEKFVVSTINEDVIFEDKHVNELISVCTGHYKENCFVYIGCRKNSYNVNPLIYLKLGAVNTLRGVAIVSEELERLKTANFEKHFSPVPVELFQLLEEAKIWSKGIVE